jgi:Cu(I)/Ag(I) efflux system membrane fusion protein
MPLEPVYAGQDALDPAAGLGQTIHVPADRRQFVGIVVETVEPAVVEGVLRLPGEVAADERRVHVVESEVVGRVHTLSPAGVGSLVREGDVLLSLSSDASVNAQWVLVEELNKLDDLKQAKDPGPQLEQQMRRVRTLARSLRNYGLTEAEIQEIERTRRTKPALDIRSPAAGYVLARDAVLGQEYRTTFPLFIIADLEQVFVLADVLNEDMDLLPERPEATILVPGRDRRYPARTGPASREFDTDLNGMRIRFEVRNPDGVLIPGMLVDVDVPVRTPETISVPVGAVVDTGRTRAVYVDQGEGRFERREVHTGGALGGRVQIVHGLEPGERVVVSGNFLLDSESRMRTAGGDAAPAEHVDPVCGMTVDEGEARAAGLVSERDGMEFFFCHEGCKERFEADPEAFLAKATARD